MATITLALDAGQSRILTVSDADMVRVLEAVWHNYKRDEFGDVPSGTLNEKADFYKQYLARTSKQEIKNYEAAKAAKDVRVAAEDEIDTIGMT